MMKKDVDLSFLEAPMVTVAPSIGLPIQGGGGATSAPNPPAVLMPTGREPTLPTADRVMGVIYPSIEGNFRKLMAAEGQFDRSTTRNTFNLTVHPATGMPVKGDLENAFAIGGSMLEVYHNLPCDVQIHIPGLRGPYVGTDGAAFVGRATGAQPAAIPKRQGELQATGLGGAPIAWSAGRLVRDLKPDPDQPGVQLVRIGSPICHYLASTPIVDPTTGQELRADPSFFDPRNPKNASGRVTIENKHIMSAIKAISSEHERTSPIDLTAWQPTFRLIAPDGRTLEEVFGASNKDYRIAFKAHVNYGTGIPAEELA